MFEDKLNETLYNKVTPPKGSNISDLVINHDLVAITALKKLSFEELGLLKPSKQ